MDNRIYDLVTERVLEALGRGVVPWRKPWANRPQPVNAQSGHAYRGVNLFLLGLMPFEDHRWVTLRQANSMGGSVKRGEKASLVVFWKRWEVDKDEVETRKRTIPLLRYFHVFNVNQCEGLGLPESPPQPVQSPGEGIDRAQAIVEGMPDPPRIEEHGDRACYSPKVDLVCVPSRKVFCSAEHFYATLFHELGHATGHEKRLARKGVMDRILFGSEEYSREELVAELASAFCCNALGLDNSLTENSASYIGNWLQALKDDRKAIVVAAAQAQKAADFIRGHVERELAA